jgi:GTPase SAR1 family protein
MRPLTNPFKLNLYAHPLNPDRFSQKLTVESDHGRVCPMEWSQPSLNFKLVVLGCLSVGKTSLVTRYCQGWFSDGILSTTGAAFFSRTNQYHNTEVTLSFWDTAGQERFKSVIPSLINGSEGLVLVYDRTNFQSFEGLTDYLNFFRQKVDRQIWNSNTSAAARK